MTRGDGAQTRLDMFETGWFGQGPAFWRWIETDAARPYIAACASLRSPPIAGEFFAIDFDAPDILDGEHLSALAAQIERDYTNKAKESR